MIAIPSPNNPIVAAIRALYGFVQTIDQGLDRLLETMKQSENSTVSRTANVIEGAKYGFGIGYITPVIILAVGQLILGNPLAAAGAVFSAAVFTNPIAMTCGAIGAIYYGWQALDDDARNAILSRLMEAFSVGAELIKAMIGFVLIRSKELLSSENLTEVKRFITEAASAFGNSLSDVTKAIMDTVVDTYETVSSKAKQGAADAHDFITTKLRREKLEGISELPKTEVADKLEPPTSR